MNHSSQLTTILRMMNGDRAALKRLIDSTAKNNPGRSAQWCLDKIQLDLERDRSCR